MDTFHTLEKDFNYIIHTLNSLKSYNIDLSADQIEQLMKHNIIIAIELKKLFEEKGKVND